MMAAAAVTSAQQYTRMSLMGASDEGSGGVVSVCFDDEQWAARAAA